MLSFVKFYFNQFQLELPNLKVFQLSLSLQKNAYSFSKN